MGAPRIPTAWHPPPQPPGQHQAGLDLSPLPRPPTPPTPQTGPLPPRAGQMDTKGRCRRGSPLPLPASAFPGAQRPRSGLQGPEGWGVGGTQRDSARSTPSGRSGHRGPRPAGAPGRRGGPRPLKRMLGGRGRGQGQVTLTRCARALPEDAHAAPPGAVPGARGHCAHRWQLRHLPRPPGLTTPCVSPRVGPDGGRRRGRYR